MADNGAGFVPGRAHADGTIDARKLKTTNRKYVFDNFQCKPIAVPLIGYGTPSGTASVINHVYTGAQILEYSARGTQTLLAPVLEANGLEISQDQTDNDGVEYTPGVIARQKGTFTVGTDAPFFFRVRLKIADVSGTDDLCIGFRKLEAAQANVDDYDEACWLSVNLGDVIVETILNNAATVTTDTLFNAVDGDVVDLKVVVRGRAVSFFVNGFQIGSTINRDGAGAAITAQATTGAPAYNFDSAEVVVPFLFFLQATTSPGKIHLQEWEYGYEAREAE